MSAVTEASVILIYAVVAMIMIFGLAVVAISFHTDGISSDADTSFKYSAPKRANVDGM